MRVIDGMHRVRAAELSGLDEIEAQFVEGTADEMFLLSVRFNTVHGLPLSLADRKMAAIRVIRTWPEWSDRAIATQVGLSHKTVGSLRRRSTGENPQLTARVGRDGRARPITATTGRWAAAELLRERPRERISDVAQASGISLSTAKDVRRRLVSGCEPVPQGRRAPRPPSAKRDTSATVQHTSATAAARDTGVERWNRVRELRSDPSLRSTEAGRTLLRALEAHARTEASWDSIADRLPLHCLDVIADLAQRCAKDWQLLAAQVVARRALGEAV